MINTLLGKKIDQSQRFLSSGERVPITEINVSQNFVVRVKTQEKDKYKALQLGFGSRKHAGKALLGQIRGAGLKTTPQFFKEVRLNLAQSDQMPKVGDLLRVSDVFKPGDIVDVLGISKGKGFAGVVKRHHFKGGPRTHGQSDRERAPGSIGQTTTPGRVYRGKRMAGRMGHERVTIKNLKIIDVSDTALFIKGLVPGPKNSLIMIKKVGEDKKFIPFYKQVKKTPTLVGNELTHEPEGANYSQANLLVKLEDTTALAVELHKKEEESSEGGQNAS